MGPAVSVGTFQHVSRQVPGVEMLHDHNDNTLLGVVEPGGKLMVEVVQRSLPFLVRDYVLSVVGVVDQQIVTPEAGPLAAHRGREHLSSSGALKKRLLILL